MLGHNKRLGFTLIELLIVIGIIGMLGAAVAPLLQRSNPRYERELFIARFNSLVQYGWLQSLIQNKVHRITVDIGKKIITLTVDSGEKEKSGEMAFKPIEKPVQDTECVIPDQIVVKQFFIEGHDMMTKFGRSKSASVWFYIVPNGMVQNAIINLNDTKDLQDDKPRVVGLVLNPFSALFKTYDTFQKP